MARRRIHAAPDATPTGIQSADRPKWLKARRDIVGASEVAAVLGLDPHKSALELWTEKVEGDQDDAGEAAEWGLTFERPILDVYSQRTGEAVSYGGELLISKRYPHLATTLDGYGSAPKTRRIHQVKTVGDRGYWESQIEAGEQVPTRVQVQLQAELLVTGADVDVLIWLPLRERKLGWVEVAPHAEFQRLIVEATTEFRARVVERRPPPPDGSESSLRALARLYRDEGGRVDLGQAGLRFAEAWERIKLIRKTAELREEEAKAALLGALGPAAFGTLPDGRFFSAREQTKSRYTCSECGHSPRSEPYRVCLLRAARTKGKVGNAATFAPPVPPPMLDSETQKLLTGIADRELGTESED